MSDDHSQQPAGEDSSGSTDADAGASSDGLEPGGGPQRVVSEQSVDDILNSLDATKSKSAADAGESRPTIETDGPTTVEFDEDEVPSDDGDDADGGSDASEAETDTDDTDAGGETPEPVEEAAGADESPSETPSVDAAAASIPDDDSLEDLAARVETGAVTGADVRAAEAGEGRESTPDVDEIDLSMDDLEATRTQSGSDASGSAPARSNDDGPLAGSIPRDDGDSSDDAADSPGLIGRIKRFFGG